MIGERKGREGEFPNVAIIIITYNSSQHVKELMLNLYKTDYPREKLCFIFIDNASLDNTYETIKSYLDLFRDSRISIMRLTRNIGFAGASFVGIRVACKLCHTYPYVVLLNPDSKIVDRLWLRKLVKLSKLLKNKYIIGALAYYHDNALEPIMILLDPLGFHIPLLEDMDKDKLDCLLKSHKGSVKIALTPMLRFSLVLIPPKIYLTIGELDPKYFMYMEDTEYCLRAWSYGFGCVQLLDILYKHGRGKSASNTQYLLKLKLIVSAMRNHLITVCKYLNPLICLTYLITHILFGNLTLKLKGYNINYVSITMRSLPKLIRVLLKNKFSRIPKGLIPPIHNVTLIRAFWLFKCLLLTKYGLEKCNFVALRTVELLYLLQLRKYIIRVARELLT